MKPAREGTALHGPRGGALTDPMPLRRDDELSAQDQGIYSSSSAIKTSRVFGATGVTAKCDERRVFKCAKASGYGW